MSQNHDMVMRDAIRKFCMKIYSIYSRVGKKPEFHCTTVVIFGWLNGNYGNRNSYESTLPCRTPGDQNKAKNENKTKN